MRTEVFSENLALPLNATQDRWYDREVVIDDQLEPFSLLLEAVPSPDGGGENDIAGWSTPHVVCLAPLPPLANPPPMVILVSIDTLRHDHLGIYGYERDTSPQLDALAQVSLVFDHVISTAPYTLPSHASLFTGLHPDRHGAGHAYPEAPLPEDAATLAEILRDNGFRTLGFSGGGMVSAELGLAQGFETWTERYRANLRSTLPAVFGALWEARAQPAFLFLHTYDVHAPYEQPSDARVFLEALESPKTPPSEWERILEQHYHRHHQLDRFSSIEEVIAAYDSGIRWVDTQLGTLFDYLEQIGLYDSSLLIVTSDHGESLFERQRYFGHSHTLVDEEIRIPLIVKLPGSSKHERRSDLAQITAIPAMILDQLQIGTERLQTHLPVAAGEHTQSAIALAWGEASHTGARFVRSKEWKLVSPTQGYAKRRRERLFGESADRFAHDWLLFDLLSDPHERDNLFGEELPSPSTVRPLMRRLRQMGPPGKASHTPPPEGELGESLRALGYL
jgi:arylsulfatase A-like enzyme